MPVIPESLLHDHASAGYSNLIPRWALLNQSTVRDSLEEQLNQKSLTPEGASELRLSGLSSARHWSCRREAEREPNQLPYRA